MVSSSQSERGGDLVRPITQSDLEALSIGVTLLGCGGGGRVEQVTAYLRHLDEDVLAALISVDNRGYAVANVMAVGYVGATTVMDEKLPSGDELAGAVAALARWTGIEAEALMPAQIGGVCGLAAVSAAHRLGLPVVDADFEGRSVPRLDQFSLAVAGRAPVPFAMTGPNGLSVVVDSAEPAQVEAVVRATVARTGGWAAFALGPFPLEELNEFSIVGSMTEALAQGRVMLAQQGCAPEAMGAALGGQTLAVGRVVAVSRAADESSFVRASFAVLDSRDGSVVRIEAGSEYLLVLVDGEPTASCPDIIAVLDTRTHEPIDSGVLSDGREVIVVTVPGPEWWTATPQRMAAVGPRAFGIDCDPIVAGLA
jgi:DUF917 family protein